MSRCQELPLLLWPISCFDRRRANPLPVYNRWYWLDWAELTEQQTAEILAVVDARDARHSRHRPVGFDEVVITMSLGTANYDSKMVEYRHYFKEVPENNITVFLDDPLRRGRGFQTVNVSAEYFEDESGSPVSSYEMIQHVSGEEFPIIRGNPESVLKLGTASAVNASEWSTEKANAIAQFLDITERIYASSWYHAPHFITSLSGKIDDNRILEAGFPDDEDTVSVLAYFRQLHAADRLVEKACDAYVAHTGDARKKWWVSERKQAFVSLIDAEPRPHNTRGKTRRQIVRMFMYGAGLLHSTSQHGDDAALESFIADHGKHETLMIFNSCLMDFFTIAVSIYPVLRQDYIHWVREDGLSAASRVQIPELFKGLSSPPHGA